MDESLLKDIRFRARQWTIDLHAPDAGDAVRLACEHWRRERPEHEKAFRDAQRVWALFPALPTTEAKRIAQRRVRRAGRLTSLAAAAALAACAVGLSFVFAPSGGVNALLADARTAPGERRIIDLPDGTRLHLNGATALSWQLEGRQRKIQLLAGEAQFEVAHDASRPMFVEAGTARIRVTGTRFDVRLAGDRTVLTLEEGSVAASRDDTDAEVRVQPNEQLVWEVGKNLRPEPADVSKALAWQRGRMVFESRPLSEVVEELSRYRRGRVLISGSTGSEIVTGVFDVSDPDAVLRNVERTLDVRVIRLTSYLTIIY